MADNQTYKSRKPLWWGLAIAAFIALALVTMISTQRSEQQIAETTASGATSGAAFDPSSGRMEPAGALRSAMQQPPVTGVTTGMNGSAGGTSAGAGPMASGVESSTASTE